jgi:hypothetical protein
MTVASALTSDSRPASRLASAWPLIVGLIVYAELLFSGHRLLLDGDTYWHLAVGRFIIDHHAIPFHDPFSFTMRGTLWSSHEWLSELALTLAYYAMGWRGVISLTALCGALGFAVLTRALLRFLEPSYAILAVIAAFPMVMPHVLARPHSLALPLMALWVAGLAAARDENRLPSKWMLPVIVLWANLHGGFTLGLVLAALFAGEAVLNAPVGARRTAIVKWMAFGALSLLASMATADGPSGLLFTADTVTDSVAMAWVDEWQSLNFQTLQPMELWMFGALLGGLTLGIRLPWTRVAMLLLLIHLGLAHARFVELTGLLGPLIIAAPLGSELRRLTREARPEVRLRPGAASIPLNAITAVAVAFAALVITMVSSAPPLERPDDRATPAAALAAVKELHLQGNVFNAMQFGGYLIFQGVPLFIDSRTDMYGDEFLQTFVDATLIEDGTLPALLQRYDIEWTLFPPDGHTVGVLDHMVGWKRAYADGTAVVHVRIAAADHP